MNTQATSTVVVLNYNSATVDIITSVPLNPLDQCEDFEELLEKHYNLDEISWMVLPAGAGYEDSVSVVNYSEL